MERIRSFFRRKRRGKYIPCHQLPWPGLFYKAMAIHIINANVGCRDYD